jgi:hypothetical protein
MGTLGAVSQTVEAEFLVAAEPAVVGLPADSVIATSLGDVAADFLSVAEDRETVLGLPLQLLLGHMPSPRTHGEVAGSDGDPKRPVSPSVSDVPRNGLVGEGSEGSARRREIVERWRDEGLGL